tara:strand:+ start:1191 stop:2030 length:840 start_codon:yes stop_codon:yes gene_type:complete
MTPSSFARLVLHHDRHLLAVNKPAGMLSQPDRTGDAPVAALASAWLAATASPGLPHAKVVHRLDRRATGVLVLARSERAATRLASAFRQRSVVKHYLVMCAGRPCRELSEAAGGRVDASIALDESAVRGRRMLPVGDDHDGPSHRASLAWRALGVSGDHALLAVGIDGGRKHQIRSLLASAGMPVVGDVRYGGTAGRALALHAATLALDHPIGGHAPLRLCAGPTLPPEWVEEAGARSRALPPPLVSLAQRVLLDTWQARDAHAAPRDADRPTLWDPPG